VGKVYASITITNSADLARLEDGTIRADQVRKVTLDRILVDTGANTLCLPQSLVERLGLPVRHEAFAATAAGLIPIKVHRNAEIDLLGRSGTFDCVALSDEAEPLLGLMPLESMGFEPDLQQETLRVLPDGPTPATYWTIY
jgi:predicted aspartyl protease